LAITTSAIDQHRLGLKIEIWSEAPFLKLGKIKCGEREDFVETEGYALRFKFKNLQPAPFPSGKALMQVKWTSGLFVGWVVNIPQLKPGQEDYAKFCPRLTEQEKSEALSSGYGLFHCAEFDPSNTVLTNFDGVTSYGTAPTPSVQSIKVTTWNIIYAKYSMCISAGALAIIALEKIIPFLSWAFSILAPILWPCVYG
jgi:hypothetical protein